ncbi:(deoxy)nucleoside triphosphate pyrophosphohydrolase [Myxococcota bacterium]|nr:(deoxy)nucleoside triphosphate pyrophosphohydrolase [Myxococcota bacterium]MBU1429939.1 (deoxy)nucleoside triphosphate pyrophosphohydrolase [Myxococcota bacterium]MBU1896562.1 (deoxy)nucleoside triphosphate pyrophosphohydrolase [Myxococcota bacterium]
MSPRLVVVAGLIQGPQGTPEAARLLISQRDGGHLDGAWEFPGGKIERGESPEAALARELREELTIEVAVGDIFSVGHHVYPEHEVLLLVYRCQIVGGQPTRAQVRDLRWVTPRQLLSVPLPPADAPILKRIERDVDCFFS